MQIKRFEAKSMTAALRMIKNELGSEAVILSAKSLRKGKGIFSSMKYAGVEVTAAIDARGTLKKEGNPAAAKAAYPDSLSGRSKNGKRNQAPPNTSVGSYLTQGRNYPNQPRRKHKAGSKNYRGLSALYQQILSQGVERGIASDLIGEIKRIPASQDLMKNGELNSQLCSILEEMGVWADKNAFLNGKSKIVALLGTAGVGKTTTIAKLAALHANRKNQQVAVITIDNYGIAANEQLKAYARIIGIPMEIAVNPNELKQAVKRFKQKDLILIDTPGVNPTHPGQIQDLKPYFAQLPEMQKHLVVSVATKEKDLIAIAEAFEEIGVQRLLFTRLDESSTYGNMLNVLIRTNIPLSFLCRGRRVPDDIEAGSIPKLVDLVFQVSEIKAESSLQSPVPKSDRSVATQEPTTKGSQFLANKNSDVYHTRDCKWSNKIKRENILQFASPQEAEAQNFLPCRSCNPDRSRSENLRDSRTAARKFSSYQ